MTEGHADTAPAPSRRIRVRRGASEWGFVKPVLQLAGSALVTAVAGLVWCHLAPRSTGAQIVRNAGCFVFVLVGPLLFGALRMVWEHARLVRRGAWAAARVRRVEHGVDSSTEHIHSYQHVHYAFSAGMYEVTGVWGAYESDELRALKGGEPFAVLYDPRRPERHLPYSVAMFEVVGRDDAQRSDPL